MRIEGIRKQAMRAAAQELVALGDLKDEIDNSGDVPRERSEHEYLPGSGGRLEDRHNPRVIVGRRSRIYPPVREKAPASPSAVANAMQDYAQAMIDYLDGGKQKGAPVPRFDAFFHKRVECGEDFVSGMYIDHDGYTDGKNTEYAEAFERRGYIGVLDCYDAMLDARLKKVDELSRGYQEDGDKEACEHIRRNALDWKKIILPALRNNVLVTGYKEFEAQLLEEAKIPTVQITQTERLALEERQRDR